ncbi:hypothetical protein GC176_11030 [bacterium]|nr:hypothetical protein [bacterium]
MTRRDVAVVLILLILPVLSIGCGDSESDGYREITAPVDSPPPTTDADDAAQYPQSKETALDGAAAASGPLPVVEPRSELDADGSKAASKVPEDPGEVEPKNADPSTATSGDTAVADRSADLADPTASPDRTTEEKPKREIKLLIPSKKFKVEGPDEAVRVSFDDVDLLKVLNMDPVIPKAPELMPDWLKQLDGKRIRIRGFMIPPFSETDVRAFTLARDTQLCCFGRNPLPYDLIDVFLKEGAETEYIELRPFDVVGVFHIGEEIEPGYLYSIDDAVVIQ